MRVSFFVILSNLIINYAPTAFAGSSAQPLPDNVACSATLTKTEDGITATIPLVLEADASGKFARSIESGFVVFMTAELTSPSNLRLQIVFDGQKLISDTDLSAILSGAVRANLAYNTRIFMTNIHADYKIECKRR